MTCHLTSLDVLLPLAFEEDVRDGDITSDAIFGDRNIDATAEIIAKQSGILSGIEHAKAAFAYLDPSLTLKTSYQDSQHLKQTDCVLTISGSVQSILKAERVALNLLQYLSGIATLTSNYVKAIEGTQAAIYDTRKTLPGWRVLAKQAVKDGGGKNHRMGLYDQFLIKENHIAAIGGIREAIRACRDDKPDTILQVEVRNIAELSEALLENPDIILLDNFSIPNLKKAVALVKRACPLEASGGVSLENVRAIAKTGVDRISVGALTHSVPAFDFSLLIRS